MIHAAVASLQLLIEVLGIGGFLLLKVTRIFWEWGGL